MPDDIAVEVAQSGGFTGIERRTVLDTRSLSDEQAATLQRLIDAADFYSLPSSMIDTRGADRLTIEVTVTRSGRTPHTVTTNTAESQPALQELITYVKTLAKGK